MTSIKPYNRYAKNDIYKSGVRISHHDIHNKIEIYNEVEISKNKKQLNINSNYKYYLLLRMLDYSFSGSSAYYSPVLKRCLWYISESHASAIMASRTSITLEPSGRYIFQCLHAQSLQYGDIYATYRDHDLT